MVQRKILFQNLEMSPINSNEIESLLHYNNAKEKLDNIIRIVSDSDKTKIETWPGNYKLGYKKNNGLEVYYGFRFGNKWYYKEDFYKPECVIYIKDIIEDQTKLNDFNKRIKDLYQKLTTEDGLQIFLYKRKAIHEARLVVKCPLSEFKESDIRHLVEWFQNVIEKRTQCSTIHRIHSS